MPYSDKEKQREYNKQRMRRVREEIYKSGNTTQNIITQPPNEIHHLKHSGQPLTMTLTDGRVIYLKYRVTQHITTS